MADLNYYRYHLFTLNLSAKIKVQKLNVIEKNYRDEKTFPCRTLQNQVKVAERAKVSLAHELKFKKHISDEIISADLKRLHIYE